MEIARVVASRKALATRARKHDHAMTMAMHSTLRRAGYEIFQLDGVRVPFVPLEADSDYECEIEFPLHWDMTETKSVSMSERWGASASTSQRVLPFSRPRVFDST